MSLPRARPESLTVSTPPRPDSPLVGTPQSAIISVPPDWASASPAGSSSRASLDSEAYRMPPSPLPEDAVDQQDPFDNTSSFAEDPFDHRSGSSSSSDGRSRTGSQLEAMENLGERRGSVVMIPHQFRSITDPLLNDGQPVDSEFTSAGPRLEGYDFPNTLPPHPAFNRTFSVPLLDRIGTLRHPHSLAVNMSSFSVFSPTTARPLAISDPSDLSTTSGSGTPSPELVTPLQTLSLELADSLQSAIQTLLHLSPPHLLDNAKEQYSGCTVQMPATSLSALFSSMRSLNYLSANARAFVEPEGAKKEEGLLAGGRKSGDFDIGELLQSVADLLGGQAAQAGVDFVLFHGDVGIKHVSVHGDGEGLAYVLSHVIRQILLVASNGDTIELGLQLFPQSPSMTLRVALPLTAADVARQRQPNSFSTRSSSPGRTLLSGLSEGPVLCIFEIVHNIHQLSDSAAATPRAEVNPFTRLAEEKESATPKLESLLCRRMLHQQNASLKLDAQPSSPLGNGLPRRAYELSVLLPRGKPFDEPPHLSVEEEAVRQPFVSMRLAREPTLAELSDFAESLRGRKVSLLANLTSLFARHLTSYLAAWGLDISHIPIEEDSDRRNLKANIGRQDSGYGGSVGSTPGTEHVVGLPPLGSAASRDTDKFIIIDDDVTVLRRELIRIRAESNSLFLRPRMAKRPTLAGRVRSTPHVRQVSAGRHLGPVLIHFTSLGNYNLVRDVIANCLGSPWSTGAGAFAHPEVMVIPKPVGPRRFLTALHTAVNQPVVDPFFSAIATSPRSPGGGYFGGAARTPTGDIGREGGFFDTVAEETGDEPPRTVSESSGSQKARSPLGEFPPAAAQITRTETGVHLSLPTPGDILATPASEYFSNTKSGSSGASAVVMQSPDGRPFGMFFEPPKSDGRGPSYTVRGPTDSVRRKTVSRRTSGASAVDETSAASPSTTSPKNRRMSTMSTVSGVTDESGNPSRRPSTRPGDGTSNSGDPPSGRSSRRKTLPATEAEPIIAFGRDRSSTVTQRSRRSTPGSSPVVASPRNKNEDNETFPSVFHPPRPGNKAAVTGLDDMHRLPVQADMPRSTQAGKEEVVVPPINVLIVEDNPINQNILSMFLRKKKMKHQSAKDGLEAVEKWRTGGFHLILMDIQLPVMDGIEATKEIRKLERNNNIGILPSTPVFEHSRPPVSESPVPSSPFRSSVIIVALTASSLQSDRVNALAAGCNDFLTKPVSLKWLEKKIVEWGCMQALIDFDGWRRWKGSDGKDHGETKRGFSVGPQAAARNLASRLRIERKGASTRTPEPTPPSPAIRVQEPTPAATPELSSSELRPDPLDEAPTSLEAARSELVENKLSAAGTTQMDMPPSETVPSASKVLAAIHEDGECSPAIRSAALP